MKNTKTHKAGLTNWRVEVLEFLNMKYEVKNDTIIYKGSLDNTLVSFLIDKSIELEIKRH